MLLRELRLFCINSIWNYNESHRSSKCLVKTNQDTSFIVLFSRFFWVQLFCSIIVSGFLLLVALRALHCTAGQTKAHLVGQGTERGRRKFWERRISMIYLCCKYVKNCNIFGQILNIWVKLILKKKKIQFFFQCLALPKDPQSFGSQNLRRPLSVSQ